MDFIGNIIFTAGSAWCVYLLKEGEKRGDKTEKTL
jgi:hypothetical protein